jgi:hypothetical protein
MDLRSGGLYMEITTRFSFSAKSEFKKPTMAYGLTKKRMEISKSNILILVVIFQF